MRTAPALILLTCFALSVAAAPAPLRYTVMDLGELPTHVRHLEITGAFGINDKGLCRQHKYSGSDCRTHQTHELFCGSKVRCLI